VSSTGKNAKLSKNDKMPQVNIYININQFLFLRDRVNNQQKLPLHSTEYSGQRKLDKINGLGIVSDTN